MQLSHLCGRKLDEAEQKIEALIEEDGEFVRKPFNPAADGKGET
jgi:exodeoxyribonuclease VII small subunit